MPRRQEATVVERGWQGCYFSQDRKRWRVLETHGVVYDPDYEFPSGHRGSLVVSHYNVDIHGDAEPDDEDDVAVMPLDEFASYFEDGGGAEWE